MDVHVHCRDFGFSVASVDMKRGEGSPGRQLDLETYLADVSIGC